MQTTGLHCETISILIVDDDKETRDLLAFGFREQYDCATAASAEEAMGLLGERFFDVVLTDVEMPGASGIELCRYIRKTNSDTIVLVMSGRVDSRNRIKALQGGAFDYITKPFNIATVARLIAYALLPPSA